MLCTYLTIQAVILFAASDAGTISEARLVGTWQSSCKDCFDIHGTGWIAYRIDHSCVSKEYGEGKVSFAHGTWQLKGRTLITRWGKDLITREEVLLVAKNRFVTRGIDDIVFTYTRVKDEPETSNQTMQLTPSRTAFTFHDD